ncbi:MAG TPA: hydroxysqualene dehydroxylase HpnE [Zoogloea sp.]|uniref:hydroxysqualene dehydroxylase HpnE n=1 Tax=Zoogloea sp. TaxID=49181 RepID=UPI002C5A5C9F|nr:hydroxysqualene dehydroxylase HpnE [Zoogloea sp.]HMV17155.1 hydroxysqualene dehydroxylase HpnE [Rhodocyclaceae bacterium]HMW52093.1 hydroxysqualene dehydroxylase HpnE [Rhodocyclaceae bacterium]HMZ75120.1 hydroxysqualene dehydroxylase HpnE [Rhodocyclaceae bacterium]HNA66569.1 hydroxysqualene dehydroxylase HpnE [Rhodocyclaceae bacterium]HNB64615.1 hydroxysqualene dehydroxylase HpnE [Rhodocyclaceae bacterium]
MTPSVAIVGGGYAGFAAAVTLARGGARVTLFEASRVLGGRARVVETDGQRVDNGQHILLGAYSETLRLLRLVGVRPSVLATRRLALVYPGHCELRAAALPAPLHLALGLLRARGLGTADKLAMLRLMRHLKRQRFRVAPDRSVGTLLTETAQTERLVRLVWEPLCVAALNTPVADASAQVFAHVLRDSLAGSASASDLLLPRVDLSELFPVPASRWLALRGHTVRIVEPVKAIQRDDTGFRLDGDPFPTCYDHVVIATAPYHVAALVTGLPGMRPVVTQIERLRHEPIVTAWLGFDGPVSFPEPMIGLSGGYGQWAFDRTALGGPTGLVSIVISASGLHQQLDRDALRDALVAELAAALGPLPRLAWSRLITEKRATFACTPGLERPTPRTPEPGLWLAGDYVASDYPATLESAVRSGVAAGRAILNACGLKESLF